MATIKSYSDLQQSKKLAEILSLESADMYWSFGNIKFMDDDYDSNVVQHIPAWSLAALLGVLNFQSLTQSKEDEWKVCALNHTLDGYFEVLASNPIDACYEMIIKLHELNLLLL